MSDKDASSAEPRLTRLADEGVMREVAGGDQEAFAEFYDRYADRVYGLLRSLVRSRSQSEEVAREVFVEAWRKARSYDPGEGDVVSWLLAMGHLRAIDRPRGEPAEPGFLHENVRAALSGLSELQRKAIELTFLGGNSYRETAEKLGAQPSTVASALRDGLRGLRRA